jgi:putative ABC transport system permease protein
MRRKSGDFDDEIHAHLEHEAADLEASGMTREDALIEACRRFGNVTRVKERFYLSQPRRWLDDRRSDLRYASRALRGAASMSSLAIAILAIGLAATTTIFSVAYHVIMNSLPFDNPNELVTLRLGRADGEAATAGVSAAHLEDWRRELSSFAAIAAYRAWGYELESDLEPQRVTGARISANLFAMLGVVPQLGRTFVTGEDDAGRAPTVILSDSLWRQRFGADPRVIGTKIQLNGVTRTVIGVVSSTVALPAAALWVPLELAEYERVQRGDRALSIIARLKPGVSVAAAQREMSREIGELAKRYPDVDAGWSASVVRLDDELLGAIRQTITLLLVATALMLLIACANLTSVMVARVVSRRPELALRTALGATGWRLMRQLGAEALILVALGGGAGVVLAGFLVHRVSRLGATYIPRGATIRLDGGSIAFMIVLMAAIAAGLTAILARVVSNMDLAARIRSNRGAARSEPLYHGFVLVQISLALLLLIDGASLVVSMQRAQQVNLGYDPENLLLGAMSLPSRYPTSESRTAFFGLAIDRISQLRDVRSVAVVSHPPVSASPAGGLVSTVALGDRQLREAELPHAVTVVASPGYFTTLRARLLRGRDFSAADRDSAPLVSIVDDILARQLAPNGDVVGKSVRLGGGLGANDTPRVIVGVVSPVRPGGITVDPQPTVYLPYGQHGWPSMTFVVRTRSAPRSVEPELRRTLAVLDRTRPLSNVRTADETRARQPAPRRLQSLMATGYAASALILAVVSVYGTLTYSVMRRTREFGVRLALGATERQITSAILRQSLSRVTAGIVLGVCMAGLAGAALSRYLYQLSPWDAWIYAGSAAVMATAALAASYLPARRAAGMDPMIALRQE